MDVYCGRDRGMDSFVSTALGRTERSGEDDRSTRTHIHTHIHTERERERETERERTHRHTDSQRRRDESVCAIELLYVPVCRAKYKQQQKKYNGR
jgi:hypothetical protein